MFDFVIQRKDQRSRRVARLLAISAALHVAGLGALLIFDQLQVPAMAEPAVLVTFYELAAQQPPPPPPPPPKKRSPATRKVTPKPDPDVAPTQIPTNDPPPEQDTGSDLGAPDGVEGGVEGSIGTVVEPEVEPEPPPPPKPPKVVKVDEKTVRKKRIQGSEPRYPRVAESRGIEGTVTVTLKIGADGRVKEILFGDSHPLFEHAIREAVASWVFAPYVVDGQAVPMETTYRFVFRLQ